MKLTKPFIGILAFLTVLFTMPLGHVAMILMEKGFGHEYIYPAAIILGILGFALLFLGIISSKENNATFLGLFGGLFIWTGWIEFAFVYYANRFGVEPLMVGREVVTKPEYLILPSSVGFWAVFMIYYFFGTKSGCRFFNWFQKTIKIKNINELKPSKRNTAVSVFLELILLLWTFYLVLLFSYDENFLGDRHFVTYIIAFGSLFWSAILFFRLLKISKLSYAIKYSMPTVIIFWNFVEILGRWDIFKEIWIEPSKYWLELSILTFVFILLLLILVLKKEKKNIKK